MTTTHFQTWRKKPQSTSDLLKEPVSWWCPSHPVLKEHDCSASVTCPARTDPGPHASPAAPWLCALSRHSHIHLLHKQRFHVLGTTLKCSVCNFSFNCPRTPCNSYYYLHFIESQPADRARVQTQICLNLEIRLYRSSPWAHDTVLLSHA